MEWILYVIGKLTFSRCFSSPVVKLSISSALLSNTVPLVSVCAMSKADVNTATFPFVTFFTSPTTGGQKIGSCANNHNIPSGSRPNTIPRTTRLPDKLPPMILTTLTLSTLKLLGFFGMTAKAASATREASWSS